MVAQNTLGSREGEKVFFENDFFIYVSKAANRYLDFKGICFNPKQLGKPQKVLSLGARPLRWG